MYYVYIIQSVKNKRYYTGCTRCVESRIRQHNEGKTKSLRGRGPFQLVLTECYDSLAEARKRETQIKSYKGGNAFRRLVGIFN